MYLDIRAVFQKAAQKSSAEDDIYLKEFQISIPALDSVLQVPNKPGSFATDYEDEDSIKQIIDSWSSLSLEYAVQWPLHLLFDKEAVEKFVFSCFITQLLKI